MKISQEAMQQKVHVLKNALEKQGKISENMMVPK